MAVALAIVSCVSVAVITHKVAILGDMGIGRGVAAGVAATAGFSSVTGQIVAGWVYDRSSSSWIGFGSFAISSLGFLLLLSPFHQLAVVVVAMILFGLSAGAALQASMYLTAQYGGKRNFGKIFGVKTSIFSVGLGLGPVLAGLIRDHFGSYHLLFVLGAAGGLLGGLLVSNLGPYPAWASEPVPGTDDDGGDRLRAPGSGFPAGREPSEPAATRS